MKRILNDFTTVCLLGIATVSVGLLTGCTVEGGTDNRSNSDAHGTRSTSGSGVEIHRSGGG